MVEHSSEQYKFRLPQTLWPGILLQTGLPHLCGFVDSRDITRSLRVSHNITHFVL
jgi:hypothetical protein